MHFTVDGSAIAQTATANASGVWSFTPTGLADGAHTIVASETDVAGNTGTASLSFTLDTTAPVAPTIASFSQPTAQRVGDGITNDNTLTLAGTAEANATRQRRRNGDLHRRSAPMPPPTVALERHHCGAGDHRSEPA